MITYYTKAQLAGLLVAWGVNEPVPKRGRKLVVAFPPPATLRVGIVTPWTQKSTYGAALYRVELRESI